MTNIIGKTCKESSNVDPFLSTEDAKKYDAWTNGHVLEMTLFLNADRNRHGQLMIELANDYVKGINNHPPSFAECFAFLLKHTPSRMNKLIKIKDDEKHEVSTTLSQRRAKPTPGSNGNLYPNMQCNNCELWGHYSSHCPNKKKEDGAEGLGLSQVQEHSPPSECYVNFNHVSFLKRAKQVIPIDDKLKDLIILDSTSTVHLFKNKKLASDLKTAKVLLHLIVPIMA